MFTSLSSITLLLTTILYLLLCIHITFYTALKYFYQRALLSMEAIRTPDYAHVKNYENVYEPAEDTFLLMDALEMQQGTIRSLK